MLEDKVDADVAVSGNVWMENAGEEADFWRVEGVVEGNFHVNVKKASFVGASSRAANQETKVLTNPPTGSVGFFICPSPTNGFARFLSLGKNP